MIGYDTSYFNDQIMLLKCLNNIIYLSETYVCLLSLMHDVIYARHFSTLSTAQFRRNMILSSSSLVRSLEHCVRQHNTYAVYQILFKSTILDEN